MVPVLLRVGPFSLYSFGLMMALAFVAGDLLVASEFKRHGYRAEQASTLALWAILASLAGARINDIVDNWSAYLSDPRSMILSGSGFVFYGGFIAGLLTTYVIARRFRIPWLRVTDMCAPALAMGHAVGRIGCQLSGDGDWGTVSTLPWAMAYPKAIVGWNAHTVLALDSHNNLIPAFHPGVRVHPAPVYETILYLGVFAILWSVRKRVQLDGRMSYLYLILAGASRFAVEFVRINPRVMFGLSEAQLVSFGMVIVGAVACLFSGLRQPALTRRQAAQAT